MTSFHISDGKSKLCTTTPDKCPIKGPHFSTAEEAEKFIAATQGHHVITNPLKKDSALKLSDQLDITKFNALIKSGYIDIRKCPYDPNLRIACYSKKTQFSGMWTNETRLSRGLIFNIHGDTSFRKATIVARGLPKFFTVEQSDTTWGKLKIFDDDENVNVKEDSVHIEMDSPASIADKLDGSMGVLYVAADGKPRLASKGSFISDTSVNGDDILSRNPRAQEIPEYLSEHYPQMTPVFEVITPKVEHVVDYGDTEDTVFLGMVDNKTGRWSPAEITQDFADEFGFHTPQKYKVKTLQEALDKPGEPNHEGIVITVTNKDNSQSMFKVKYDEFYATRKIRYGIKDKDVIKILIDTPGKEILSMKSCDLSNEIIPGTDRETLSPAQQNRLQKHEQNTFNTYVEPVQKIYRKVARDFAQLSAKYNLKTPQGQKDFAAEINQKGYSDKDVLFSMKTAYLNSLSLEDTAVKFLLIKLFK